MGPRIAQIRAFSDPTQSRGSKSIDDIDADVIHKTMVCLPDDYIINNIHYIRIHALNQSHLTKREPEYLLFFPKVGH